MKTGTLHARIREPYATTLRLFAKSNHRPVSMEVQIAIEQHLRKPKKRKSK